MKYIMIIMAGGVFFSAITMIMNIALEVGCVPVMCYTLGYLGCFAIGSGCTAWWISLTNK